MRWLLVVGLGCAPFASAATVDNGPQLVYETKTQHTDFNPGGTIRIGGPQGGSHGSLNVVGWDKPEVEVTVIKSTKRLYSAKETEDAKKRLDLFVVTVEKKSPSELTISTSFPHRTLQRINRGTSDLILEYQIHVPSQENLVVHHGTGDVVVTDVAGDIDARVHMGDIVLMLPTSEGDSIDARSSFGGVESDFGGAPFGHFGHRQLSFSPPAAKHKLFLRVGAGSINIQAMPVK